MQLCLTAVIFAAAIMAVCRIRIRCGTCPAWKITLSFLCFSVRLYPRSRRKPRPSHERHSFFIEQLSRPDTLKTAAQSLPSLRLTVKRLRISVGVDNAAKTALTATALDTALSAVFRFLENTLPSVRYGTVSVTPIFFGSTFSADADIRLSVRLSDLITAAIILLILFSRKRNSSEEENTSIG